MNEWNEIWSALGAKAPAGVLEEVTRRYAEPHRAYRTLDHIAECFAALEGAGEP